MQPVLDHLQPRLADEAHALLTVLVSAMGDGTKIAELDQFDVWRETEAGSLE